MTQKEAFKSVWQVNTTLCSMREELSSLLLILPCKNMRLFGEIKPVMKGPFPVQWSNYPKSCAALRDIMNK